MGINGLNKFLRDKYSGTYEIVDIQEYSYKKVAIDISLYLYKFKIVAGEYRWITAFINMIAFLRKNNIHCLFVYDNGCVDEKLQEQANRRKAKENTNEKIFKIKLDVEEFERNGIISEELKKFCKKNQLYKPVSLLNNTKQIICINRINDKLQKMQKYDVKITERDIKLTKELFDCLDVPYINAILEAETTCVDLYKRGLVDAVMTEDSDVLAYGGVILSKMDVELCKFTKIDCDKILEETELTYDEFLDFCIMCGTDYNSNIPKVGPVSAFKLIKEHKTIESIEENTKYDTEVLNYKRTREIFKNYEEKDVNEIPFCGFPDFEKLRDLLIKNNIDYNIYSLRSKFSAELLFVHDDHEDDD